MNIAFRAALSPIDRKPVEELLDQISEFTPEEITVAREVLSECMDRPSVAGYSALVALIGDEVVGYVCYGKTPMTRSNWEIYWLAVAPSARNMGIGSELLKLAESDIVRLGGYQITLETSSQPLYEKARKFYLKCGFKKAAVIPDFYDVDDDLFIYMKKIN